MAHEHHHHGHGHGHHGHEHGDGYDLTEMLLLDAEVTAAHLAAFTGRIAELAGEAAVHRVVDLGSGTGTGAFALLRRFPGAVVTAIDTDEGMLRHLTESAARHGVADRIRPLHADAGGGLPETGEADLVWASSSMHHMNDPDRVLADIHATLRPGGLLAMIEMESMPRFLPDDIGIGAPGLEARCHALADAAKAEHLPHMGSDWPARLRAAGFTVLDSRDLVVDLAPPLPAPAVRYAVATLKRFRAGVAERLSAEDRETLDTLLAKDEHVLRHLPGLSVHSTRSAWIATPA
ncbi:class I SAM-dependent methyltransferase [Actinoplanes lobatus]|uniref:SAM-dependent methyltransferase n=2 Tax=Actinoplanes lobatus TaxID=113568 RepID=A0A7W7HQJ0_9ACTN|nr:class I SAM-dependent methyltransferase [Actinoplanes lobatus]MBB4754767.1 SAM-dependent methyltransferase [Actinoplanes lobatus]